MKKFFKITALVMAMVMVFGALAGCASSESSGEATTAAVADDKTYTVTMQGTFSSSQIEYAMMEEMIQRVADISGGKLVIELAPLGTYASSLESWNACSQGVFDLNMNYGTWFKSADFGFHVLTTGNMSMDWNSRMVWLKEFGGQDIAAEAFAGQNVAYIGAIVDGTECANTNEIFEQVSDMEGLIFRTSDARLLNAMGISGVTYSLEELFTAFSTGAVDIAEYGYIAYNRTLGLTDVAKYGMFPDFWNVSNTMYVGMNQAAWDKLPAQYQELIKLAFNAYELEHWARTQYAAAIALNELEDSGKWNIFRLSGDAFAEMRQIMYEQVEAEDIATYGEDSLTAKVYNSYYDFYETWYPYYKVSAWWGHDLTAEECAGFAFQ